MWRTIAQIFNKIFRVEYNTIDVRLAGPAEYQQPVSVQSSLPDRREYTAIVPASDGVDPGLWESEQIFVGNQQKGVFSVFADGDVTMWIYETDDGENVFPIKKESISGSAETATLIEVIPTRQFLFIEIENTNTSEANVDIGVALLSI